MNSSLMLGKRIRHLSRYREIAYILMRNGFGWFVDEIGLTSLLTLPKRWLGDATAKETLSVHERIRQVLEQLGPTFTKLGQVASLRTDLFPAELVEQLSRLRDEVPPMSIDKVERIVEAELGRPIREVFSDFSPTTIGSASIGQVHKAVLSNGFTVAVKVQRQDIKSNIVVDFEILEDIVRLAERNFEWAQMYRLVDVVDEFRRTLLDECDYTVEARNADRLRTLAKDDPNVFVPEVHWDFCTEKVLVMDYVDGQPFGDVDGLTQAGFNPKRLAARACEAVFTQILVHGFFHADPHPGNLAALPGDKVAFMDFGMVGRLTPEMKRRLGALIVGLMRRNTEAIIRALKRMGVVPLDIDDERLRRDVDALREKYYTVPLSQVNMGDSIRDIFGVAYQHQIRIPADLALVGKTLVTIEGVVERLDPSFRILDIAEAFGGRLLREQFDPLYLSRKSLLSAMDSLQSLVDFPRQIGLLVRDMRRGKTKVQLEVPEIQGMLQKLDRITNRISFSVMILALSIFMAGLMISSSLAKPSRSLFNLPFTDVGFVVGAVMVLLLIWSIFKSGRM